MMLDYTKKFKKRQKEEELQRQMANLIDKQLLPALISKLGSVKKKNESFDTKGERILTS